MDEPTINQTPTEPTPEPTDKPKTSFLFDTLEMFAWSFFAVFLLLTFFFHVCEVDGRSMEDTLYNGERLLVRDVGYTPEQDDIIIFTRESDGKRLVKRVIATGGQTVEINFTTQVITVDGVEYADSHRVLKNAYGDDVGFYLLKAGHHYDPLTDAMKIDVPEGKVFVLGDNRNNSNDSRGTDVGLIDERMVLGKVVLRFYPFAFFS